MSAVQLCIIAVESEFGASARLHLEAILRSGLAGRIAVCVYRTSDESPDYKFFEYVCDDTDVGEWKEDDNPPSGSADEGVVHAMFLRDVWEQPMPADILKAENDCREYLDQAYARSSVQSSGAAFKAITVGAYSVDQKIGEYHFDPRFDMHIIRDDLVSPGGIQPIVRLNHVGREGRIASCISLGLGIVGAWSFLNEALTASDTKWPTHGSIRFGRSELRVANIGQVGRELALGLLPCTELQAQSFDRKIANDEHLVAAQPGYAVPDRFIAQARRYFKFEIAGGTSSPASDMSVWQKIQLAVKCLTIPRQRRAALAKPDRALSAEPFEKCARQLAEQGEWQVSEEARGYVFDLDNDVVRRAADVAEIISNSGLERSRGGHIEDAIDWRTLRETCFALIDAGEFPAKFTDSSVVAIDRPSASDGRWLYWPDPSYILPVSPRIRQQRWRDSRPHDEEEASAKVERANFLEQVVGSTYASDLAQFHDELLKDLSEYWLGSSSTTSSTNTGADKAVREWKKWSVYGRTRLNRLRQLLWGAAVAVLAGALIILERIYGVIGSVMGGLDLKTWGPRIGNPVAELAVATSSVFALLVLCCWYSSRVGAALARYASVRSAYVKVPEDHAQRLHELHRLAVALYELHDHTATMLAVAVRPYEPLRPLAEQNLRRTRTKLEALGDIEGCVVAHIALHPRLMDQRRSHLVANVYRRSWLTEHFERLLNIALDKAREGGGKFLNVPVPERPDDDHRRPMSIACRYPSETSTRQLFWHFVWEDRRLHAEATLEELRNLLTSGDRGLVDELMQLLGPVTETTEPAFDGTTSDSYLDIQAHVPDLISELVQPSEASCLDSSSAESDTAVIHLPPAMEDDRTEDLIVSYGIVLSDPLDPEVLVTFGTPGVDRHRAVSDSIDTDIV